ncbi:MAG: aminoglycoside phosphotransferase [Halomonadaceae bacterium]|nr:MAG: aminoglycoside phosphotransferase [Halomonadaceae bacterium]
MDKRYQSLLDWLHQVLPAAPQEVAKVAGDASFRRYFRAHTETASGPLSWIVMDAPPEHEDCAPFVAIARHWQAQGLHVPEILAEDRQQGFLLLEDLGDQLYSQALTQEARADILYGQAINALVRIQTLPQDLPLPAYDAGLLEREMQLFPDWLLKEQLGLSLTDQEQDLLASTFALLRDAALEQPRATVHRDYHSRNLLVTGANSPGIIDFQDAVIGPVTYDLVSLLKDCYVRWPVEAVARWVEQYRQQSQAQGLHQADSATFTQWFELMGMQRHLKAAGIFARLAKRDGKAGYLADVPRTVNYLIEASQGQPALQPFGHWLTHRVWPHLHALDSNAP